MQRDAIMARATAFDVSGKQSKPDVHYTDHAMVASERCRFCRYFDGSGSCQRVQGAISPDGWCRLFSRKTDTAAQARSNRK